MGADLVQEQQHVHVDEVSAELISITDAINKLRTQFHNSIPIEDLPKVQSALQLALDEVKRSQMEHIAQTTAQQAEDFRKGDVVAEKMHDDTRRKFDIPKGAVMVVKKINTHDQTLDVEYADRNITIAMHDLRKAEH